MARKSERRKGTERRADRDSKRVAAPKAAKAAKAVAPPPPPAKIKFRGKLLENEPLARHNTWRIGGPARGSSSGLARTCSSKTAASPVS